MLRGRFWRKLARVESDSPPNLPEPPNDDLAGLAEAYIAAIRSHPDRFPAPAGERPSELEQKLGWSLEMFVGGKLDASGAGGEGWWTDGIDFDAVSAPSERKLVVRGRLWSLAEQSTWMDPVMVTLELAATLPQIESYEVAFRDAETRYPVESGFTWSDFKGWLVTVQGSEYPPRMTPQQP